MFCSSAGPVKARFHVPPYFPTPSKSDESRTIGFLGNLSSTGGRSPDFTFAAKSGDSP